MENQAFTDRVIRRLQPLDIADPFVAVGNEYLMRHKRLAYDAGRNLFWVTTPSGPPQVAVWMMPVCIAAEQPK